MFGEFHIVELHPSVVVGVMVTLRSRNPVVTTLDPTGFFDRGDGCLRTILLPDIVA